MKVEAYWESQWPGGGVQAWPAFECRYPAAAYVEIRQNGYSGGYPLWRLINGSTYKDIVNRWGAGKASAQGEVQQNEWFKYAGNPSRLPYSFFGTNLRGYNGTPYALYVKAYNGWNWWTTSIPVANTYTHEYYPWGHYSAGYSYYYFGAWPFSF